MSSPPTSGVPARRAAAPGRARTEAPTVTVVVPATDSPPTLPSCLTAIALADPPPEEVIVVGEPAGLGPAAARNRGAAAAGGELICFVDSDVEVHPDAFGRIRASFADPALGAVFGSYDAAPAAGGTASRFRNLLHAAVHRSAPGRAETFWAGLGAVRASALRDVGGFDAALFPRASVEDVELGARLRAAGVEIELDPRISGRHLKRWSLASMLRTDLLARAVPWTRLILAGRAPAAALNLAPRRRLAAALSAAAAAALLARRPGTAATLLIGLVAAERPLFALLARSGGSALALAGLPLLVLHHLAALTGAAAGAVAHLLAPLPRRSPEEG